LPEQALEIDGAVRHRHERFEHDAEPLVFAAEGVDARAKGLGLRASCVAEHLLCATRELLLVDDHAPKLRQVGADDHVGVRPAQREDVVPCPTDAALLDDAGSFQRAEVGKDVALRAREHRAKSVHRLRPVGQVERRHELATELRDARKARDDLGTYSIEQRTARGAHRILCGVHRLALYIEGMSNRLAREASPYLKQHGENPVDWYPWGEEALLRAKQEDRPIILSIGYSACHWCHVMEHESFEDAGIAGLMNEHFISIKVDREERPDIDQIYQLVVQLLGRSGGWPLTVFLTPEQKPFFAGTYFPPVDRHGMPGFPRILTAVAEAYRERRADIDLQSTEIAAAITQVTRRTHDPTALSTDFLAKAVARLSARFDDEHGGFGSRPKFPSTMSLELLLRHGVLNGDRRALARVQKALDGMRAGGIYDQLGGGFHRYSTDERWLVPHFEKMLYDNALLLRLYIDGYRAFGDERYAATAREIVGYVEREMLDGGGGFYATQDADSEGHEGKFFVWTRDEVSAACGDDAALACARFGVDEDGNFEGTASSVLHLATSVDDLAIRFTMAPSEVERRLATARAAMFAHREKRTKPFRDEKILASWNGLFISALADAARTLAEPSWLALAERAFDFVWRVLTRDNRVLRHAKDGVAKGPGFLDDQAFVGCAALDLYEATGNGEYVARALALAETIRAQFVGADGRLYLVASDGEPLIARPEDVYDHAIPSATSMALTLFVRLGTLVSPELATAAEKELGELALAAMENPFGLSQVMTLVDRVARTSTELVLVGESAANPTLLQAAYAAYIPHRTIAWVSADGTSAAPLLASGKARVGESVTAFVCRDHSCSAPLTGYREVLALLSSAGTTPSSA
jgi:uncharacterized protein YyaL (SSP411 family)